MNDLPKSVLPEVDFSLIPGQTPSELLKARSNDIQTLCEFYFHMRDQTWKILYEIETGLYKTITPLVKAEKSSPPFNAQFPFEKQLASINTEFNKFPKVGNFDINNLPELNGYNEHFYNYWKNTLCIVEPVGFHYYESYEIRSRFAAGMVWSGICGLVVCILSRLLYCASFEPYIFISSLIIYISFAVLLKRACEQEVKVLFLCI
jgi:hypothetical protein